MHLNSLPHDSDPTSITEPVCHKCILVVENDTDWINQYQAVLEDMGFEVRITPCYAEAVGLLRQESFILAIIDLKLVDRSDDLEGIHLLEWLIEKRIPGIIVSGWVIPRLANAIFEDYSSVYQIMDKVSFSWERFKRYVMDAIKNKLTEGADNPESAETKWRKYELLIKDVLESLKEHKNEAPDTEILFQNNYTGEDFDNTDNSKELRVDVAVPRKVLLDHSFVMACAIRQKSSAQLKDVDLTKLKSGNLKVHWPVDVPYIQMRIQINAPECEILGNDTVSFNLAPDQDSSVYHFMLVPQKLGSVNIVVNVYQTIDCLGSAYIKTIVIKEQIAGSVQVGIESVVIHIDQRTYENAVFVSYAWGGESESIVDELERTFAERGIRIVRDKKDLAYKGSIEAFERRIGRGQCIVLVVSDKYLHSEHCMYELVEVGKNRDLRDRIFPIVLSDARIYKAIDRLKYIKYWEEQIEELNQAIKQVGVMTNLAGISADLDTYASIRASFDHLTDLLSDMNALTPEMHTTNGFSTLIDVVETAMAHNKPK